MIIAIIGGGASGMAAALAAAENENNQVFLLERQARVGRKLEATGKAPKTKTPEEKREAKYFYRLPAICTVKIMNGVEILLQSRVPVYQLGQESSLPVNVIL